MNPKVTMHDVAAAADVSVAVVSRVLNNHPAVRLETRQRVQAVMRRMEYRPDTRGRGSNPDARRRRPPRQHQRVLLLGMSTYMAHIPPVYLDLLSGVEAELRQQGYALELQTVPPGSACDPETAASNVDGGILLIREFSPDIVRLTQRIPCVRAMGVLADTDICDHVTYDNDAIGPLAAKYLLAKGHRRCAVVCYKHDDGPFVARRESFRAAFAAAGGETVDVRNQTTQGAHEFCLDSVRSGWATAAYCVADMLASTFHGRLRQAGIQPGQDLEIVSTNFERSLLQPLHPPPAVVNINAAEVGRRAVQQLLWRLTHAGQLQERTLVNVSLLEPAAVSAILWPMDGSAQPEALPPQGERP